MSLLDPTLIVKLIGFGGFLWLGIYIVSRAVIQTPLTIVSCVGMIAQSSYFLSSTIITNSILGLGVERGVFISRLFWWSDVIPMALWFHMSVLIARQGRFRPVFSWPIVLFYLAALLISVVGEITDFFLDYSNARGFAEDRFYVDTGAGYSLFMIYLLIGGIGAFFNLFQALRAMQRNAAPNKRALASQIRLLAIGALLFMIGALWLAGNFYFKLNLPELPGNLFVLLGLGFLGYGVAHFDMLIGGQNVQRDFIYSFTGVALISLVYVVGLCLTGVNSTLSTLVVVGLAVATHTNLDFGREILDKFFFNASEQTARSEARAYATAIASQPTQALELEQAIAEPFPPPLSESEPTPLEVAEPEPISQQAPPEAVNINEKSFNDMVRRAITGLKSPPQMIKSPLLSLHIVKQRLQEHSLEDNRLNRASALRELLIERIEHLRPTNAEANGTGEAWRFYNVLYYPYIREISRKSALSELRRFQDERRRKGQHEPGDLERILEWLVDVDEDTFYKWQRKASDTIAAIIREEELKLAVELN
ncbi:MAG: hypothetical protein WCS37_06400 [Chloroflexota bacterium]|nr:hypothetical protein [Chloroflexota bacterium]